MHICGFIAAIGVSLATIAAYNQFWKLYATNHEQGIAAFRAFNKLLIAGMIGMIVILAAGITMLAIEHWTFASMLWMQIKLVLVVLIFVNGLTLGRTASLNLRKWIEQDDRSEKNEWDVTQLRRRLNIFFILQLGIYASIIFLSVFRFT